MSKDNQKAFKELGAQLGAAAQEVLRRVTKEALDTIKLGYSVATPVLAEDGTPLSKIDPKIIAPAVSARIEGFVGAVFIVGSAENDEAHRQYALGGGADIQRNPFLGALKRLQNAEIISKVTGLSVK